MRISPDVKLDFQDVRLVPQRSSLDSRADVNLIREFTFPHSPRTWKGVPIISANMDSVGTFAMAKSLSKHKMLTALHKHYSVEQLVEFFVFNKELWDYVFYTVGSSDEDFDKLERVKLAVNQRLTDMGTPPEFRDAFPKMLNVDVANGYTESFIETVVKYRKTYPDAIIMAGNICTANMAEELILKGADIAKVGLGSGAVCRTRVIAGVGVPQLSAIDECSHKAHGLHGHTCSDGGITCPGDASIAFGAGGDFVMIGGLFAGTDECEGDWTYKIQKFGYDEFFFEEGTSEDYTRLVDKYISDDRAYTITRHSFKFHGMSSKEAQEKWHGGLKKHRASEGKEVEVPYKGSVADVVQELLGGISSACTYSGARRLKDLPKCAEFCRVNNVANNMFGKSI